MELFDGQIGREKQADSSAGDKATKIASSILAGTGSALIGAGSALEAQKRNQEFQEYMATNNLNFQMQQLEDAGFNPALTATGQSSTSGATITNDNRELNTAKAIIIKKLKEHSNNGYKTS